MASTQAISEEQSIQEMQEGSIQKLYISDYNLHCLPNFVPSPATNSLTIYADIHKPINSDSKQNLNQALQSVAENTQILQLQVNKLMPFSAYQEKNIEILQYLQDFKRLHSLDIQIGDKTKLDQLAFNQFLSQSADNLKKLRIELRTETLKQNAVNQQFGFKNMFIAIDKLSDLSIVIADNNNLKEKGAIQLAEGISMYQGLQKLDLKIGEINQISSQGIKAIMKSVIQMKKLKDFSFEISDTNNLGSDGIFSVIQMVEDFIWRGENLKLHIDDKKGLNSKVLQQLFEAFTESDIENRTISLRELEIIISSQLILNGNAFLEDTFIQCYNLESLTIGILADLEISKQIHPICSLISSITNLKQLRTLNFIIPKEGKFDLDSMALLGSQIKQLTQMQSLRISIGASNSQKKVIKKQKNTKTAKGKGKKTQQTDQKEEMIVEEVKEDIQVPEPKQACFRNLLESISSLIQLKKLDLEIHKDNLLEDEGWECLGDISNLRELKVKLSNGCGISDISLHGLAKAISNMANLEGLQLDIGEEIEISRSALTELFENPRRQQMKKFQSLSLRIGKHTECGDELLISLSQSLVFSVDSLKNLSLSFEGSNGISNKGTIQFFEFIQKLKQLHVLSLRFDENNEICDDSMMVLNSSIEKLKHLQEIDIYILSILSIGVKAQLGLYGTVASLSLRELLSVDILITSKERLEIVSQRKIIKKIEQPVYTTKPNLDYLYYDDKPLPKLVVNTPQGIQCNLSLNNRDSLVELPEGLRLLPQNLTEYELTLPSSSAKAKNTKKSNQKQPIKFDNNTINNSLSKIPECFSSFPSCSYLNISIPDYLIEELSFDSLAAGISRMKFLSELKLHTKAEKLSLTAAQQLGSLTFLEKLNLELELSQKYPFTEAITVILRPLFISKYIKEAQVSIQSFYNFKLEINEHSYRNEVIPISQNLSENQLELKCILEVSQVAKKIPPNDNSLFHIGRLLSIATIPFSIIEMKMKGYSQIDTQSMDEFAKGLAKQTSITDLVLEFSTVPSEGVLSLTESLRAIDELRKISLSIDSDELFQFGPALAAMDNLMNLSKHVYMNKITINGLVILSNQTSSSDLVLAEQLTPLFSINPHQYKLFKPIEKTKKVYPDTTELSTVAIVLQRMQKNVYLNHLSLNATTIQGDWQQFELELNNLQNLDITDSFLVTPSLRSFSLESMLAKLPGLRVVELYLSSKKEQKKKPEAIQVEEQSGKIQTIPLFGSQLKFLSQITYLDLNLNDFSFGEDVTGAGLCEGINGIKNSLNELFISFTNQSHLQSQGLINLSAVIGSSSNLKKVHLQFLMNEQDDYLTCIEILRQFGKSKNIMSLEVELTLPGDNGKCLLLQGNNQNQTMNQKNYPVKFNHLGTQWRLDLPGNDTESMKRNSQSLLQYMNKSWQDLCDIEIYLDYEDKKIITRNDIFMQSLFEFLSIDSGRFLKQLKLVVVFSNQEEFREFQNTALRNITSVCSLDLQFKVFRKADFMRSIFDYSLQSWQVFLLYLENICCLRISDNAPGLALFVKRNLKRLVSVQLIKPF